MKRKLHAALLLGALGCSCAQSSVPPVKTPPRVVAAPKTTFSPTEPVLGSRARPEKAASLSEFREGSGSEPALFIEEGYDVAFASKVDLTFVAKRRGGVLIDNGNVAGAR